MIITTGIKTVLILRGVCAAGCLRLAGQCGEGNRRGDPQEDPHQRQDCRLHCRLPQPGHRDRVAPDFTRF